MSVSEVTPFEAIAIVGLGLIGGSIAKDVRRLGLSRQILGYENNVEMVSMAFWTVLKLAGPVLIVALIVGLTIGIIQAATSINEMTLSFVPKVVIVILTIAIFTNYLLIGLTDYFMFIFERVASLR